MKNNNSQVSGGSISSPLLLSEPPDIKNWFSSYTYQSPALDSNEDFCNSPTRINDGEYEKQQLYVEDSEDEKVENYVNLTRVRRAQQPDIDQMKNDGQSMACEPANEAGQLEFVPDSDSLSLLSEPPDIANWFASYAYESPEIDSADFDASLSPNQTLSNSQKAGKENNERCKVLSPKAIVKLLSCKELISNDSEMNGRHNGTRISKSNSASQKRILEGNNCSSENSLYLETTSEQSIQRAALGDSGIHSEVFTGTREYKIQTTSQISDNDSGWIQLNRKSREVQCKRSKLNEEKYLCTENGLTSLMKKPTAMVNDENSPLKLGARKYNIGGNVKLVKSREDKRTGEITREVLKETTNNQYSYAQESTGKWRCPQKNKPNIGPPLKQLRLERWVHRI